MSFFPVECAILWLADFFQNHAVSRASVNRTCQKGPLLPQSFSTKVAIESGLYIAPGMPKNRLSGRFGRICQVWQGPVQKPGFWPDPAKPARSCQVSDPARILAGARIWPDLPNLPEIEILARSARIQDSGQICWNPDFSGKSWFLRKSRFFRKS